jgi:hypothetical protein
MTAFRRRLASGALLLTALQLALLFAAPVSACCGPAAAAGTAAQLRAADEAPDCCPPGAHPAGECPLHNASKKQGHCRMTCDRSSGAQLVLGAIGVLTPPVSFAVPFSRSAVTFAVNTALPLRLAIPDAPPPKLL